MFRITVFIFSIMMITEADAQLSATGKKMLQAQEAAMKDHALDIVQGRSADQRLEADSLFTRMLVGALKTDYSFYYPFDSLKTISILEPEDHRFRIFTWQLYINGNVVRYHGAIQMNTRDGSLKLFPLIDRTSETGSAETAVVSNLNWLGALYYNLIRTESNGKSYYTLFGFKENGISSNSKIIEVLTFDNNQPVFGAMEFGYPNDPKKSRIARYIMEYKKDAVPKLNFDKILNMIILEHLTSETGEPQKKYTYIPDGDYEGFRWKNGKWNYIEKVFTDETPGNMAPISHPLLDEKGNVIESNLKHDN